MTKVSIRLDYLLDKYSLEDQFKIASEVGIDGVETGQLLDYNCNLAAEYAEKYNVPFIACGFYDMWASRLGTPFSGIKDNLIKTIECAKILNCSKLLSLTDNSDDREDSYKSQFIENMKPVIELCEKNNLTILIEPHSTKYNNPAFDFSRYFLDKTQLGYELIDRIGSDKVKLLFDFYHVQTMEGDIIMNIRHRLKSIGHFHIAGTPDRDEPWNGELNYLNLVGTVKTMGYDEYFGLEYYPTDSANIDSLAKAIKFIKEC